MKRYLFGIAIVLASVAQPTWAAVIGVAQQPVGNVSYILDTGDGTWDYDQDYGYNASVNRVWMNETWIGSFGDQLGIDNSIEVDETRGTTTTINFRKNVENTTGFDWTDFHIDLLPNMSGGVLSNVMSLANAEFGNAMVMDNMDGSYSLWWDNFSGGTGVPIGSSVTLDFSFDVSGTIGFKMVQMPTPEPATFALLGLGGLALVRRRR